MSHRARDVAGIVVVACVMLTPYLLARLQAHDLALARAHISVDANGRFVVEILADARSLLAQLAARNAASQPPDAAIDAVAAVQAQLPIIASGIDIAFDRRRLDPDIEYVSTVAPALAAGLEGIALGDAGTLRLTGVVPAGVERVTFAYRWTYGPIALTISNGRSGDARITWIAPGERSPDIPLREVLAPGALRTIADYLALGFTHIVPKGLDHMLFVLGLFLLGTGWRGLLTQVSAFTVAHTCSLALTMVGALSLPARVVEPLIALSIAYVAVENLVTRELRASRLALVFGFGLLHGMGFAGVLTELGFPPTHFTTALLSFNAGVELGQLGVLGAAALLLAACRRHTTLPQLARPASLAIAFAGLYWTVDRVWQ